ncbi:PadR family transcriptional regulator [Candidatus Cyanaurora vandensis]|uniref:PadR family transcriptional regulator n=1 Tax=Candidatus Cyanaurora vandensis TaxID=2714958 RepID=UPI00257F2C6D|nr:PadR family transcriptional regulator [Candidatus Cyanaurora vandensis]
MALKHTLLAFLARQSLSGYEIAKEFEEGFGSCFWKASQQQIYAELAKLEQQGEISYEAIPQLGRLDKKIYSLTPQGQQHLVDWLQRPTEPTVIREDLGVMGLAGHLIPPQAVVRELGRRRALHAEKLRQMQTLTTTLPMGSPESKDLYMHLILRRAIRYQEDWVAWCDEALQAIAQHG